MPKRIQLKRIKGWRKPEGAVVVSRPTKWGNPWTIKDVKKEGMKDYIAKLIVVTRYHLWLTQPPHPDDPHAERRQWILDHLHELEDKDLACWCGLDEDCHADTLICLANGIHFDEIGMD